MAESMICRNGIEVTFKSHFSLPPQPFLPDGALPLSPPEGVGVVLGQLPPGPGWLEGPRDDPPDPLLDPPAFAELLPPPPLDMMITSVVGITHTE